MTRKSGRPAIPKAEKARTCYVQVWVSPGEKKILNKAGRRFHGLSNFIRLFTLPVAQGFCESERETIEEENDLNLTEEEVSAVFANLEESIPVMVEKVLSTKKVPTLTIDE